MSPQVKRSALGAVGLGVAAGAVFAAVLLLWSAATGAPPWLPLDAFASVLLGRRAFEDGGALGTLLTGALVNIAFSGAFGFGYGALNGQLPTASREHLGRQLLSGMIFGGGLYAIDFQLIARVLMPWLLESPQLPWLFAHVLVFGPLVAVMYAMAERREQQAHPLTTAG